MHSPSSPRTTRPRCSPATPGAWPRFLLAMAACSCLVLGSRAALAQVADSSFWRTDGAVYSIVQRGNTVYVGGSFGRVAPFTGALVPIDPLTGSVLTGFPVLKGYVNAIVSDGAGGWFVGGNFASVGGLARANIARIGANFSVSGWSPVTNGTVTALSVHGGKLYVAGEFTVVNGQARAGAAALDVSTGAVTAWDPAPNSSVVAFAFDGGTVFACGGFTNIGGRDHRYLAALDTLGGASSTWDPNPDSAVNTLVFADGLLYAGGEFGSIGGASRKRLAALDPVSGSATAWNPDPSGPVKALEASGQLLYVGGGFRTVGGQPRTNIAALDRASGAVTAWSPQANATVTRIAAHGGTVYLAGYFSAVGARSCRNLAAVDSATAIAAAWNPWPNSLPIALGAADGCIWVGGVFTSMGGVPRANLAALDATTGLPLPWAPDPNGTVRSLAAWSGVLYAGGEFTQLAGQPRSRLGAVDTLTGAVTAWRADADGTVQALVLGDGVLYAGGAFAGIGGAPRQRLAALDLASGSPTAWSPATSGPVYALALRGTTLYAGGAFVTNGYASPGGVVALSTATGQSTDWRPSVAGGIVRAIAVTGNTVFVGGSFWQVNGTSRPFFAPIDAVTGIVSPNWNWPVDQPVYALLARGDLLYAGGQFSKFGGQTRHGIAAIDIPTGSALPWDPDLNGGVTALATAPGRLLAGGTFTYVGAGPTANLGAIEPAPDLTSQTIRLTVSQFDGPELSSGAWSLAFVFQLSRAPDEPVSVDYTTADGTATAAGLDYVPASGTLTFQPGESAKAVHVQVNGDRMYEPDETFQLLLSNPSGAQPLSTSASAILRNDDPVPSLSVANIALPEGASGTTPFPFTLSLSNPTYLPVTVLYATNDGYATVADGDFVAASGVATVPAGSLSTTVTVAVHGDVKTELDENFFINFSGAINAALATTLASATILNDDTLAALSIDDIALPEGTSGPTPFTFTLRLSRPVPSPVTVLYATADGSATVADGDFEATFGMATVPAESLSTTITVAVFGDTKSEPDETFTVELHGIVNAALATAHAVGTILTDDLGGDVAAVRDVAPDQGGWVWLDVDRNVLDDAAELTQPVATYNVWRLVPPGSAEAASMRGAVAIAGAGAAVRGPSAEGLAQLAGWPLVVRDGVAYVRGGTVVSAEGQTFPPGTWAIVNSFAALQRASYTVLAPTQSDSPGVAEYVVSAHTIKPAVWFVGHAGSGWSVDNIAPAAPLDFSATPAGAGVKLAWGASTAADFLCFRLHRGAASGFVASPSTMVAQTSALEWIDDAPGPGTAYYALAAVDSAGNASPASLASASVTAGGERPTVFALGAPAPSPCAGTATLHFSLPQAATVRITVYDAAGRRVRELVSGEYPAGVHVTGWDGLDATGSRAPAGLYLCRMEANGFRASRRIVLVK